MQGLLKALLVANLMVFAAAQARTESLPDVPKSPTVEKTAEQKGDQARIHKDYASAVAYYHTAVRGDTRNSMLYDKLAIAEFQLGDKSAARKHLTQAVKLDSRSVAALNNLGVLDLMDKKYKASVNHLKQALALDESNATAHLNIAEAWIGLGEVDRAMTEYSRALELNADILNSDNGGVVAQVTTPEQRARISYLIAKSYAKKSNLDGALEYLRRAKDGHYPDLARVYSDQEFAALWSDPRLEKIVKR
jgi:tetratricopeptide (TPR) repeat protein